LPNGSISSDLDSQRKIIKKVAILEIGGSHDECLLSQFSALKAAGVETYFISSYDLWHRNSQLRGVVDHFIPFEMEKKNLNDFLKIQKLNRFFVSENITVVIFNTAQGAHVRNFCLTASKKVEFVGIIHTINKFKKSFTQKIIHRKIKKYFVLNDYLLSQITPPSGIQVQSFYPLRFPKFDKEVFKSDDALWIVVIGGVEFRRKDLLGSLDLMDKINEENIRYVFLGKSDPEHPDVISFKTSLQNYAFKSQVILFDAFIDEETYDAYLKKADFIWPMVHPGTPSAAEYFKNQISGAMNISFGYKIPMLVHEDYVNKWDDLHYAFSYRQENFYTDFQVAKTQLKKMTVKMIYEEKFSILFQEKNYINFLFPGGNIQK
jgi:hypothetical protein